MQRPSLCLSWLIAMACLGCPAEEPATPDGGAPPEVQTFGGEGDTCAADTECQRDLFCLSEVCSPGVCDLDRPCDPWQDCRAGICEAKTCDLLTPCPHLRPCLDGRCVSCTQDEQCADTEVCHRVSGRCQAICDGGTPCPESFVCEGGSCLPLVCDEATACGECRRCNDGFCALLDLVNSDGSISMYDRNGGEPESGDIHDVEVMFDRIVHRDLPGLKLIVELDNLGTAGAVELDGVFVDALFNDRGFDLPLDRSGPERHTLRFPVRQQNFGRSARVQVHLVSDCGAGGDPVSAALEAGCAPSNAITEIRLSDGDGLPTRVGDRVHVRMTVRPSPDGELLKARLTVASGLELDLATVQRNGLALELADSGPERIIADLGELTEDTVLSVEGTVLPEAGLVEVHGTVAGAGEACFFPDEFAAGFLQVAGLEGKSEDCLILGQTTSLQVASAITPPQSTEVFRTLNGEVDYLQWHGHGECPRESQGDNILVQRTSHCIIRPEGQRVILSGDAFQEANWGVDNIFYFESFLRRGQIICDPDGNCPPGYTCGFNGCQNDIEQDCRETSDCPAGTACLNQVCKPLHAQMVGGYLWPGCELRFTTAASGPNLGCQTSWDCPEGQGCHSNFCRELVEQMPRPSRMGTTCGHTSTANFCFPPGLGRRDGEDVALEITSLLPAGEPVQLRITAIDYHVSGMNSDLYVLPAPPD